MEKEYRNHHFSYSDGGASRIRQVDCLINRFAIEEQSTWQEGKTGFRYRRKMSTEKRIWIQHMLVDPVQANILANAGIWGAMFVSLFNYEVDRNMLKAMISFSNRRNHTFIMKTREMCYSLRDVNEIAVLPTCGSMYDEHLPERFDMLDNML